MRKRSSATIDATDRIDSIPPALLAGP